MDTSCKLCGNPAQLRRSHIIPEFLYRPLYDEKHRFTVVSSDAKPDRFAQRGLTEPLLCGDCETRFSRHENYASGVIGGRFGHVYRQKGIRITVEGIDYAPFKLFQLSILWRAATSSLEFFRLVELGPHTERLRQMLLSDDPGKPETYGCAVVFATERGEDVSDTFFNPAPLRWAGHRMTKFFFAGSAWLFHCDRRHPPEYLRHLFLQLDGSMIGLSADLEDGRMHGREAARLARRLGY